MSDVAYAVAVALAATFGWAGAAKLRDQARTTATFGALGVPAAGPLGRAVPAAELVLAAGLLLVPAGAGLVALALLAGFTAVLVRAVRAGTRVACGCFGSAGSEPVSEVEVLRNVVLAAGAATVAGFADGPVLPGLDAVVLVSTTAAVAAVVVTLADVRRRTGQVFGLGLGDGTG